MKLYTCWELGQYNALREEIQAQTFCHAMHIYVRNRGYRAQGETIFIPMAATSHKTDCTIRYIIPVHPIAPSCVDREYHVWVNEGRWKGVDHEVCQWCGLHRTTRGDGVVTQKVIKYIEGGIKPPKR